MTFTFSIEEQSVDRFTRDDLNRLADTSDNPSISIYMPTRRAGRDVRENAPRFKNLLRRAHDRLRDCFPDDSSLKQQLQDAAELERDEVWWQHQSDGLALFFTPERFECYRVPIDFEETVNVGRCPEIRPMVRLLQGDGRFYVLAVSQKRVRLLEGSHFSVQELDNSQLPSDLRTALNIDEYTNSLQQHTTGGPTSSGTMMFHGHGAADMSVKKQDEIRQFFRRISAALTRYEGTHRVPLVFAGVDYLFPLFRETWNGDHLVDPPVTGNPDDLSAAELHQRAWTVVEPLFAKQRKSALQRYNDVAGSDKAVTQVAEVVRAARHGAVDTLMLADGQRCWGVVDESSGRIEPGSENGKQAEDLLNYAAVRTLTNSGAVYCLSEEEMPGGSSAAAVLRFPISSTE